MFCLPMLLAFEVFSMPIPFMSVFSASCLGYAIKLSEIKIDNKL